MKVVATPIKAKDLKPGDLFSIAGPNYWRNIDKLKIIGEKVYIRTNNVEISGQEDVDLFCITIER